MRHESFNNQKKGRMEGNKEGRKADYLEGREEDFLEIVRLKRSFDQIRGSDKVEINLISAGNLKNETLQISRKIR
jgi:hypothetical protein